MTLASSSVDITREGVAEEVAAEAAAHTARDAGGGIHDVEEIERRMETADMTTAVSRQERVLRALAPPVFA